MDNDVFGFDLTELEHELNTISATGTIPRPPDWRKSQILNNDGLLSDARKFLEADWWKRAEPRDGNNREILRLVERGQLRMGDGKEEENQQFAGSGTPVTASEIAEHQRDKAQRRREGSDVEEQWREYVGQPRYDAREWLADLAKKLDANTTEKKGWWGTLRDHVYSKAPDARIEDLNQQLIELCLKNI